MKRKAKTLQIIRSNGEIDSISEDERKIVVSFSSETPTGTYYKEILSHNKGAVDLSVLNGGASVLYNHDPNQVIGKIVKSKIENRRGIAEIIFDDDEFSEKIFKKVVVNKSIKGVSVGAMPIADSISYLEKDQSFKLGGVKINGPATIYKKWQPREISITPIPADNSVGVNRRESAMEIEEIIEGLTSNKKFMSAIAINEDVIAAIKKSLQPEPQPEIPNADHEKQENEKLLKRAETVSASCKGVVAEMILTGKQNDEISDYIVKTAMAENKGETFNPKNQTDIDDNFILSGLKM